MPATLAKGRPMRRNRVPVSGFLTGIALLGLILGLDKNAHAQQVHRNGFESLRTSWVKSGADAAYTETTHAVSDQGAHDGQRSEYLRFDAKAGTYIYYQYSTGRAAIGDELSASIWLKGSRPGAQLVARVVLPNERDPNNLDQRLSTLIRGDVYRMAGKWQRLEIGRPVTLLKQQQQLMQAQYNRPIDTSGAYIDTLILNVYSGPGPTELWIDDLEIGPVQELPAQPVARPSGPTPGVPAANSRPSRAQVVEFNGNQLL